MTSAKLHPPTWIQNREDDARAPSSKSLSSPSRTKTHGPLIASYEDSTFSASQKSRMAGLLESQSFTARLEGSGPTKMSKSAQFYQLVELSDVATTIELSCVDMITRGKLQATLTKAKKRIMTVKGLDTEIGEAKLKSVRGPHKELLGYIFAIPISVHEQDMGQAHYFNDKGEYVGFDYM